MGYEHLLIAEDGPYAVITMNRPAKRNALSLDHLQELIPEVLRGMREAGIGDVPVVVGGIIPDGDAKRLRDQGVAAVFTPKDFGITEIMSRIVDVVRAAHGLPELRAGLVTA